MTEWHDTDHFVLDRNGTLWLKVRAGDDDEDELSFRRLGPVEDAAGDVARELLEEAEECLDLWADGFDERAEVLACYFSDRVP